jgi:hypothetical protein
MKVSKASAKNSVVLIADHMSTRLTRPTEDIIEHHYCDCDFSSDCVFDDF